MEKLYQNKDWLYEQYIKLKKSMLEIAKECNCSAQTILNWLIKNNLPVRSKSEAREGIQFSDEHRQNLSKKSTGKNNPMFGRTGKKNPNYGKHRSIKTKLKISKTRKEMFKNGYINSFKNKHHSEEAKQKNREKHLGKKHTKETRELTSKQIKGENHPMYGKHHTPKSRKLMSKTMKQKYKNGYVAPMKDKHFSKEHREKISETRKKKYENGEIEKMFGDKHPRWNPNRTERYAPYGENFYDEQLRNESWALQGGRDLLTGQKLEWGKKSHYHHIDWDKSNDNSDNHIWLNYSTHGKVHSKLKRKYYENILKKNLRLLKQGKVPETWKAKNKEMFRQENMIQLQLPIHQIIEKEWCYGY